MTAQELTREFEEIKDQLKSYLLRMTANVDDTEAMHIRMNSPQGNFEIKEHFTFCFTCISKSLPLEQHICLLLKEVYDFKVQEIGLILDNIEAMVKYYLHTARSKMADIFEGRCALIKKKESAFSAQS